MTRAYMTRSEQDSRESVNLDLRYGEIGISAVAAALHCTGDPALLPANETHTNAPVRSKARGMNSRL